MTALVESALAKINLTLEVLGRRVDGYHELTSLVVFAEEAFDRLTARTAQTSGVIVAGRYADAITGPNLAADALQALHDRLPVFAPLEITLEKALPVASGLGGGSADAAAVLRLARRAEAQELASLDLIKLARSLGADVPVCLESRAAIMSGTGEDVQAIALPPGLAVVLVNALGAVPEDKTARVFGALRASSAPNAGGARPPVPVFASAGDVISFVLASRNDLQNVAARIMPEIPTVLEAIARTGGCRVARLSGAGGTCFGLYASAEDARVAARMLARAQPQWWVKPSAIV